MITRRQCLLGFSAAAFLRGANMTSIERVHHALKGEDVDRAPFTFWHHFLDETKPAADHAKSTLAFHERYRTDLVKVMSDYAFPKPLSAWYELKMQENPYPRQLEALASIRQGLAGKALFVETIFNPWNVAEKLSSKKAVSTLMKEQPQKLLDALEAIAKSEASHARKAVQAGASGIFLAIANAQPGVMTEAEYVKFSEPFDRMVLAAVRSAPLNVLHLHADTAYGDKLYLNRFTGAWPAAAINYTQYAGVPIAALRKQYAGVLMAGLDERKYRKLEVAELKREAGAARAAAGKKFILAPGCSVPNDSTAEELSRLPKLLGALVS
jgi:uroporphyrinogen decarboxylase